MAIMAPVQPRLHRTPLLIAGPDAAPAQTVLQSFGMSARVVGAAAGQAPAINMIRSVMIKGMEALSAECFLAARRAGVEAEVIGSLVASNPKVDWPMQAGYNKERMMRHGIRRAAEMREAVRTLRDLGLAGDLTRAVADWQDGADDGRRRSLGAVRSCPGAAVRNGNLRHLRVFVEVARGGSVARAAEVARVSQPAVTQALSKLEARGGMALFHRTPQGLFPTRAGEVLRNRCLRALDLLDQRFADMAPRLSVTASRAQLAALVAVLHPAASVGSVPPPAPHGSRDRDGGDP